MPVTGQLYRCAWRVALIATLAAIAPAANATAAVHSDEVTYNQPTQPLSIGPTLPIIEQAPYFESVAVSYDDIAGSVTLSVTQFASGWWGPSFAGIDVYVTGQCGGTKIDSDDGVKMASNELHISVPESDSDFPAGPLYPADGLSTPAPPTATATLAGHTGEVSGSGTFDGTTFTFTVSDPAFVQQDWFCTTVDGSDQGFAELTGWPVGTAATRAQLRAMTTAANLHHAAGFVRKTDYLYDAGVVDLPGGDWAAASATSHGHKSAGNDTIVFRFSGGRWRVVDSGFLAVAMPTPAFIASLPPLVQWTLFFA
jgi:hypothetical protein